jgi:CRP-like cAMP-binding protein
MSVPDRWDGVMADATRMENRLLDLLPDGERSDLISMMDRGTITPHDVLQAAGQPMRKVHFPMWGVISLMTPLADGTAIETATIGNEGMVGVHAFLGGGVLNNAVAMSQVPGEMLSLGIDTFRAFVEGDGKMRDIMMAYTQALFVQIAQAVACNGVHEIQQRAAKWFLETHDRVEGDEFLLTQEFLADMLGVTRPSVSVAAGTLQAAGLITYRRGQVIILDRPGLEEASCECYAVVRSEYEKLLSPAP